MYRSPRHHLLIVVFLLSGCAATQESNVREEAPAQKTGPRLHREHAMQAAWRGRSYLSLLEKYGPPRAVMTHPGTRDRGTEVVVYGVRDVRSNCIDAFTVLGPGSNQERIVMDYFCR